MYYKLILACLHTAVASQKDYIERQQLFNPLCFSVYTRACILLKQCCELQRVWPKGYTKGTGDRMTNLAIEDMQERHIALEQKQTIPAKHPYLLQPFNVTIFV